MSTQRLIWADSLKGWLMLLVILGHVISAASGVNCPDSHVWNMIYSFHMPAFMMVSGWLAFRSVSGLKSVVCIRGGGYFYACKRRAFQLLIPYFVWSLISFTLRGNYSFEKLSLILIQPDNYYWFLWVLFWICVLFNGAQELARKFKVNEIMSIWTVCLTLLAAMVIVDFRFFGFQFIAYYYLFYTVGYCMHRYKARIRALSLPTSLIALTIVWALLAWGWSMHGLPSWVPEVPHVPASLLQYAYRGATALVGIVALMGIAPRIMNNSQSWNLWLSRIGVISLGFYTGHIILLGVTWKLLKAVLPSMPYYCNVIILFLIVLVLAYFMISLISRNKYTARILLGKK